MNSGGIARALLIGCGRIGAGAPPTPTHRGLHYPSHAAAIAAHPRLQLIGCIDPDSSRRHSCAARWRVPGVWRSSEEAIRSGARFDVAVICSPTEFHRQDVNAALSLGARAILCEKPIAHDVSSAEAIVTECRRRKAALIVNYSRRWDPMVEDFRRTYLRGDLGELRAVTGVYNKGLVNNGSHLVDLLDQIFGSVEVLGAGAPMMDHFRDDPSIPFTARLPGGARVAVECGHAGDFALFEATFYLARSIVSMEQSGMVWRRRPVEESSVLPGYRFAGEGTIAPGGYLGCLTAAIDDLYLALESGSSIRSNGESALRALKICHSISEIAGSASC